MNHQERIFSTESRIFKKQNRTLRKFLLKKEGAYLLKHGYTHIGCLLSMDLMASLVGVLPLKTLELKAQLHLASYRICLKLIS